MEYPNSQGHFTLTWDPSDDDEVAAAKATFETMKGRGMRAFHIKDDDSKGRRMDNFDPSAERITLVGQLKGG